MCQVVQKTCAVDYLSHALHWISHLEICTTFWAGSSELLVPSFAWRSGVFGTTAYFVLAHGLEGWTSKEARALITALFIAHGLFSDFAGRPLDFTAPIAKVLHAVLNIPMPQPQVLPVKAKDAEPSGIESKKGK